jgi:spermidine synthase
LSDGDRSQGQTPPATGLRLKYGHSRSEGVPTPTSVSVTQFYVPHLFGTSLFLSAFLLFLFQPMVGKMLLPWLGGAAGVWTTCVLFFQAMLLAGYVYAHLLSRIRDIRKQVLIHGIVLLIPFAFLPVRFTGTSSQGGLLLQLLVSASVPFFAVSATAPLLQSWYSRAKSASSHDPYFLYAASNAGSLLALIAYPFVIEPALGISIQNRLWLMLYGVLVPLLVGTASFAWNRPEYVDTTSGVSQKLTVNNRLYWTLAAFVPSALMLAVTNHISADLASVPFLWAIPLAIYLLTFILAFARRGSVSSARISALMPIVLLAMFPLIAGGLSASAGLNWILIGGHLLLLFCGALLCHTALAERRPDPEHLTEFYFWIALGGVLGGIFTATLAPLMFKSVFEYPLLVAMLAWFRATKHRKERPVIPIIFGLAMFAGWSVFRATGADTKTEALALAHTALIFACYKFRDHLQRFAFSFAILILGYAWIMPPYIEHADRIYTERNFFGVKKVLEDRKTHLRTLLHGSTIHGIESRDPARMGQPLSYYHSSGNVGEVMNMLRSRAKPQRMGVIGLGSGSMAAYAGPDLHVVFYEIDPSVEKLARDYFTFLPRCMANCDVQVGDGRLKLAQTQDASFDLLMLDAFSSDSIPVHLMSKEALQLYLAKLRPDGILLFHTSNRYLDVDKLVFALISDAGLVGFSRYDEAGELRQEGKTNSSHVVAARHVEDLGVFATRPGWTQVIKPTDFQPWTDDYSNLLELIRWH